MSRKVLLISTTVPETFSTILRGQPAFLAKDYDVVLVSSCGTSLRRISESENCFAVAVPMVRGISPIKDVWSILCMIWVIMRVRPDMVHSYTPKAGMVTMLAAWICRTPVRVHTFTGLLFPTAVGIKKPVLTWVDRLICACATVVVPESVGVMEDLHNNGVTSKAMRVIGKGNIAGVDTSYYSRASFDALEVRRHLGLPAACFVFCFVGRLNKDKGFTELVSAFIALQGDAHLLVVGGLDRTSPIPAHLLKEMESHPRIHCLGFLNDIRPILTGSDILILPSYREGFPNVVLQAGAMELPSIVTDVSGSNEIISPGFNGWIVPTRDAKALGRAMRSALDLRPEDLGRLGKNARLRVLEDFEQRDHWFRMMKFYEDLHRRD